LIATSVPAYRAPWWLPGGHAQTIHAAIGATRPKVSLTSVLWDTPDGDRVRVDSLAGPLDAPLVVLFHGLEGSGASHYAVALAEALQRIGWRLLIPHWRGCGGQESVRPRAYHSGDTVEASWMLERAASIAAGAPLFAMGVSLGGNVLLKFLGDAGERAGSLLRAAAAVSAPLDLAGGGDALEFGVNRLIYTRMFLATMKPKALAKLDRFPELFDADRLRAARTLRTFDDVFTAPLHGFRDAADYWARASSKPVLRGIALPTLVINALNDPFLPPHHLPSATEVSAHVTAEYPRDGGHVGFVSGAFPGHLRWLPLRIITHFQSHLDRVIAQ
jgi:uncharacterized protein